MENYEKVKKLGKGSFGEVSLVKCKVDNKLYALKKISVSALETPSISPLNEIQLMQSFNHPNIIKYYDSFEHKGELCIVMEYADSGDLSQKILEHRSKNIHFDEDQILDWLLQICLSLNYLHENKIVHRDIKITNIFLSQSDLIKVGDFGISKKLESTGAFTKTTVGTPYYLPPEMLDRGNYEHYNYMVDVWMLGCVIYELCTFEKPFYANGESWENFFQKICFDNPKPIPSIYSPFLHKLVNKMLNKIPNNRIKITEILEIKEIQDKFEELKDKNKICQEYFKNINSPFVTRNSLKSIIKKRKSSFVSFEKSPGKIFSSENSILHLDPNDWKEDEIETKNQKKPDEKNVMNLLHPQICKKPYQKAISINTAGLDIHYTQKKQKEILIDSTKNMDTSIPTEKVQTKKFSFIASFEKKSPNSSNRTILSSEFLKNKLGKEKFEKMNELIENSTNPVKFLEDKGMILEIIGEKNLECIEIYKFLISNAVTPSNSNPGASLFKKNEEFMNFCPNKNTFFSELKK